MHVPSVRGVYSVCEGVHVRGVYSVCEGSTCEGCTWMGVHGWVCM